MEAARRPIIIPIPRAGRSRREPRSRWEIKLGLEMTDGKEQLNGSQTHDCSDSQHLALQKSQNRGLQTESDVPDPVILLLTCIFVALSFIRITTLISAPFLLYTFLKVAKRAKLSYFAHKTSSSEAVGPWLISPKTWVMIRGRARSWVGRAARKMSYINIFE